MGGFISPNWHVVLIHFPIALVSIGLVVELLSLLWPRETFRAAGCWMILFGALLSVPAATAGLYAFRDTVVAGPAHGKWYEVVQNSHWNAAQWEFMHDHIWLNSWAVIIFLAVVFTWIVARDRARQWLYWPLLIALIVGVGLMTAGAWHGGESVYRYGTGVEAAELSQMQHEAGAKSGGIKYYLPPLQLHVVLAGLMFASVLGALALTLRARVPTEAATTERATVESSGAGWWVLAGLIALLTVFAGAWAHMGGFSADALKTNLLALGKPEHLRLLLHVIAGLSLLALPFILAAMARMTNTNFVVIGSLGGLLFLAVAAQVWLGILLLYDTGKGPITGFSAPPAVAASPSPKPTPEEQAAPESTPASSPQPASPAQPAEAAPAATVQMTDDLTFEPKQVTIRAGETVEWTSPGVFVHTVTADPAEVINPDHVHLPEGVPPFNSGKIQPGDSYRHTFTVSGHYKYFCIPHEADGMFGEVEVQ